MEIIIHRGENQIGGNIIEISTKKTRILLDVGQELDEEEVRLPNIDGLFDDPAFDAELEEQAVALFKETTAPIFVLQSSANIGRIVTMYRGGKKNRTHLPARAVHGRAGNGGGHADADTIRRLIAHVNPTEIIPVHTENAAWFHGTE